MKYLNLLATNKTGNIIAIAIILVFGLLSVIRLYPFENSLTDILNGPTDDWNLYARFALDIKHNGILLSSVHGDYYSPNAFLYNYFLAFCFLISGENTVPVFIIQNLLLGLSIALIYWAFRNKMSSLTGIIFLITLFLFGLFDVCKHYTFRFLGENLVLFTIASFFFCFIKGIEKNKLILQIFAAVFLGMSILIRPNIFPSAIALMILIILYFVRCGKKRILNLFLFILFGLAGASFLSVRNHVVSGTWTCLPSESIFVGKFLLLHYDISLSGILKKLLFCFGFLFSIAPQYQWRPHWTVMWIGYFIYLFSRIKAKKNFKMWEITSHLFILSYYGLLILITDEGHVSSYGFRYFIPATFIVLPFSFITADKLFLKYLTTNKKLTL